MSTERFIGSLTEKYAQLPGYPFAQWANDISQFNALHAYFGEMFKAAAGRASDNYEDVIEPRLGGDFSPCDVALKNRQKRVAFYPDINSTGFLLVTNFATDGFEAGKNLFGEMPDRSWFTIACDFNPARLNAVFQMVQTYIGTPFTTLAAEKQMNRNFIKSYGHLFDYPLSKRKLRRRNST
jgi:hypothetical protein